MVGSSALGPAVPGGTVLFSHKPLSSVSYGALGWIPGFDCSHFEEVGGTPHQNSVCMSRLMAPHPHQEGT